MPRPKSGLTIHQLGQKYRQQGAERRREVVVSLGHSCYRCHWGRDVPGGHMALTVLVHGHAVPSGEWRNVKLGTRLREDASRGAPELSLICINCQTVERWNKGA